MEGTSSETRTKQILFCKCGGERIDPGIISDVSAFLAGQTVHVTVLTDLCGLAATKKKQVTALLDEDSDFLVIGCYRRSMNLLLGQISGENNIPDYQHINLLESSKDDVVEQVRTFCSGHLGEASFVELTEDSGWPSWYPLIDYTRCTACMQCADFCLFGVYDKTDGRVEVNNPQGCKNNCPACARICPSAAIIFPKYKNGGAVGGSDLIDENAEQKRQSMDIEDFLGSDIYTALEKRKAKRQSIIRGEAMKKAIDERDNALKGKN